MSSEAPKVLLVDDDKDLLQLIAMRLSAAGYAVATADSGETALASLTVSRPQLVITDLRMQGMDGLALFDAIHRNAPSLPVVILTAHGTIPEAVAATRRGVFSFLTKPFDSKLLLDTVADALRLSSAPAGGQGEDWRAGIITRSPAMEDLLAQARRVAASDASVCIYGQSGTGKELLARAIHRSSRRSDAPFVAVNCSAIPEGLLESELFGHKKGSFTGATQDRRGLFQAAQGGTLFLDEVGDMPLAIQVKLLRALEERVVRRCRLLDLHKDVGGLPLQLYHLRELGLEHPIVLRSLRLLPDAYSDGLLLRRLEDELLWKLRSLVVSLPG